MLLLLLRSFACVCCWLLEGVVSTLSFHVAAGRVLFKLGSAIARHIYVAHYIIASTLRVGFLASFSYVSKYLTDWDICNEAYSVIADEGDISFLLQVFDLTDEVL
jgi:hypothetical protein